MVIVKAAAFAARAHQGQFRKDGITPYFYHCAIVANIVERYCFHKDPSVKDCMVAAAYLHDTVEDCDISLQEIQNEFGVVISGFVDGLTNVYTKKAYPEFNRAERKRCEANRLSNLIVEVKQIKLADRLANVMDLDSLDGGFKHKFVDETRGILHAIGNAHPHLNNLILEKIT
jgi:(p)ppGpp synthase/HD superfamily hydrolase